MGSINSSITAYAQIRSVSALAILTFSLSACSAVGMKPAWRDKSAVDYELIASNLVNSLAQSPHLVPSATTIQLSRQKTAFGREVEEELLERGFTVEHVAQKEGVNQVSSAITPAGSEERNLYMVSIGQVSAEREFDVLSGRTLPVSEQVIRGVKPHTVVLNDEVLFTDVDNAETTAQAISDEDASDGVIVDLEIDSTVDNVASLDPEFSVVVFKAYEGPQIDEMLAPSTKSTSTGSWWNRPRQTAVKRNMYETMSSNYKGLFAGYEDIDQSVLIFPNDSLRLGDVNKGIIERYVAAMDPDTDVLSVIGCSHGETDISNGNSLLALGRANRVKEALLFSGLEHDKILDEGCWAPQVFDDVMPRRGVVLTLKRQKKS